MYRTTLTSILPLTALCLCALTGCENNEADELDKATPLAVAEQQADDAPTPMLLPTPSHDGDQKAEREGAPSDAAAVAPAEQAIMAPPPPSSAVPQKAGGRSGAQRYGSMKKGRRHGPGLGGIVGDKSMRGMPSTSTSAEAYDRIEENAFVAVADDARSTFSIDVDTASYSNMRRFLDNGTRPPVDAIRIEEMINYFSYDYKGPSGSAPFSMTAEVGDCPWNESNRLVHVGLQGKIIDQSDVPSRNLVFLFDVSGSMNSPSKLPLLKRAFSLLVDNMRPDDTVSIVVYAGASGVVLEPTSGKRKGDILAALDRLSAGGSTNGGAGIHSAYAMAKKGFIEGGINRVILATDGDFNVGATSQSDLVQLVEDKRRSGVFLSVLGFGTGNLKDATMEKLADKGNGNYAYIDSISEARKVLVEEAGATLVTIAKDVKIQVEFNPTEIASYRLIGYENRKLAHSDFNDDTKDAGEIGAGHSVTALYEVVPAGAGAAGTVDALKYQDRAAPSAASDSGELMTVKVRYKNPDADTSKLLSFPITDADRGLEDTSRDFRFSAAVAGFGMLLRGSEHKGDASFDMMRTLAEGSMGTDARGRRNELLRLIDKAAKLADADGDWKKLPDVPGRGQRR